MLFSYFSHFYFFWSCCLILVPQIFLIVPNGRLVRFVCLIWLLISFSCSLVYKYHLLGLILFSAELLLVFSDLGAVAGNSVGVSSTRFERHIFRRLLVLGSVKWWKMLVSVFSIGLV